MGYSVSQTAEACGVSRSALYCRMLLHGVDRPNTTPIGQDRKFRDLRVLL